MGKLRPTSRQVGELYGAYMGGNGAVRERVVQDPALVLKVRAELGRTASDLTPAEELQRDLRIVTSVARRAVQGVKKGALDGAGEAERARVREQSHEAHFETGRLLKSCDQETSHAGSDDTNDHLPPA
jgi:hypothetical protein